MRVTLHARHCTRAPAATEQRLPASARLFLCCAAALITLVFAATIYHICFKQNGHTNKSANGKGSAEKIILLFSAVNNVQKLTYVSKIRSLQGFNLPYVFFMLATIIGHRGYSYFRNPIYNAELTDWILHSPYFFTYTYGTNYVNLFFAKSGFSLAYFLSEILEKSVHVEKVLLSIIYRFVRMTPLYLLVIMFHIFALPHFGSGPMWWYTVGKEQENCAENWWTNILYINNYVEVENMCILRTWYLSAEFQMHILCSFLVYIKWQFPKIGWTLIGIAMIISITVNFLIVYQKEIDVFLNATTEVLTDVRKEKAFKHFYISIFSRLTAYLIGVIGGIIMYTNRSSSFRIPKVHSYIFLMTLVFVIINAVFLGFVICAPGTNWHSTEAAASSILYQAIFGFIICGISVLITFGDIEILMGLLTSKWISAVSQLGYAAYLLHGIPHLYEAGIMRYPLHLSFYQFIWSVFGDFCIIFFASLLMFLTVEAPMRSAARLLLRTK